MKKNWIKITLIAIFVVTNVATFIFAQGRVKIVEKMITIYKEIGTKNAALPAAASLEKMEVAFAGSGALKKTTLNFNDSDYLLDNKKLKEAVSAPAKEAEITKDHIKTDKPEKKLTATVVSSDTTKPYNFSSTSDGSSEAARIADENIPIPQLPLFDTDFEVDANSGGLENVALPQLPDMS